MAVPTFSFLYTRADPGRSAITVEPSNSDLFNTLKAKFGLVYAEFLATHLGFEDNGFTWESVRPLGKGSFGMVGL